MSFLYFFHSFASITFVKNPAMKTRNSRITTLAKGTAPGWPNIQTIVNLSTPARVLNLQRRAQFSVFFANCGALPVFKMALIAAVDSGNLEKAVGMAFSTCLVGRSIVYMRLLLFSAQESCPDFFSTECLSYCKGLAAPCYLSDGDRKVIHWSCKFLLICSL